MKYKVALLLAFGLNHLFGANLLFNGDFESPVIGNGSLSIQPTGSAGITNWIVTGAACNANCVLILDTNYTEPSNVGTIDFNSHGGLQSLDITGGGNTTDGGVQQTVNLNIASNYTLSFWVGNMDDRASSYASAGSLRLFLNGADQGSFTNTLSTNNANNWAQFTLNFTATQVSNTIQFVNNNNPADNFAGLDDVFLDEVGGGVPEPATFGLMALALGGIELGRRRLAAK